MKIKIQAYKHEYRYRSSMACMENNNHPSAFQTRLEKRYRIVQGKKVLADGFCEPESAKKVLDLNWTQEGLNKQAHAAKMEYYDEVEKCRVAFEQKLQGIEKQFKKVVRLNRSDRR